MEHLENSLFKESKGVFSRLHSMLHAQTFSEIACVRSLHTHGAKHFHFSGDWAVCLGVCVGSVLCPVKDMPTGLLGTLRK